MEPAPAFLQLIGRFVVAAADLEGRILADPVASNGEDLRRQAGETSDAFWDRLDAWVTAGSTEVQDLRGVCADALYEVSVWRDRISLALPRVRNGEPPVLVRKDPEFDAHMVMDDYYFHRLCRRVADWHAELDSFEPTPPSGAAVGEA